MSDDDREWKQEEDDASTSNSDKDSSDEEQEEQLVLDRRNPTIYSMNNTDTDTDRKRSSVESPRRTRYLTNDWSLDGNSTHPRWSNNDWDIEDSKEEEEVVHIPTRRL